MPQYPVISRDNNFDLVRLFAAIQVVFFHIQNRLGIIVPGVNWFSHLPGVPIFFTVSGFLITASFLRNRDRIVSYFVNRYLRIYPAIYVLIFATTVSAVLTHSLSLGNIFSTQYAKWGFMWATYDQNYTPPFCMDSVLVRLMEAFGLFL